MRGIVHHLSVGLFGRSLPLPDFPTRKDIVGIGLSDWPGYAQGLAKKLGYTNTFYHEEPFLDITAPASGRYPAADFLISTDVFEHVPPPVERAFTGSFALLKPGGILVLTVPFNDVVGAMEHFPDLHTYKIVEFDGGHVLLNRSTDGQLSVREKLVFHGGPGETLEMRTFSKADTLRMLAAAGFVDIAVHPDPVYDWGILPLHNHGLPMTARRPKATGLETGARRASFYGLGRKLLKKQWRRKMAR